MIKSGVQLQCPGCRRFLEKLKEACCCPVGHLELNTIPEGYPILKGTGGAAKPLLCGEDFKDGTPWQKAINDCKEVAYLIRGH